MMLTDRMYGAEMSTHIDEKKTQDFEDEDGRVAEAEKLAAEAVRLAIESRRAAERLAEIRASLSFLRGDKPIVGVKPQLSVQTGVSPQLSVKTDNDTATAQMTQMSSPSGIQSVVSSFTQEPVTPATMESVVIAAPSVQQESTPKVEEIPVVKTEESPVVEAKESLVVKTEESTVVKVEEPLTVNVERVAEAPVVTQEQLDASSVTSPVSIMKSTATKSEGKEFRFSPDVVEPSVTPRRKVPGNMARSNKQRLPGSSPEDDLIIQFYDAVGIDKICGLEITRSASEDGELTREEILAMAGRANHGVDSHDPFETVSRSDFIRASQVWAANTASKSQQSQRASEEELLRLVAEDNIISHEIVEDRASQETPEDIVEEIASANCDVDELGVGEETHNPQAEEVVAKVVVSNDPPAGHDAVWKKENTAELSVERKQTCEQPADEVKGSQIAVSSPKEPVAEKKEEIVAKQQQVVEEDRAATTKDESVVEEAEPIQSESKHVAGDEHTASATAPVPGKSFVTSPKMDAPTSMEAKCVAKQEENEADSAKTQVVLSPIKMEILARQMAPKTLQKGDPFAGASDDLDFDAKCGGTEAFTLANSQDEYDRDSSNAMMCGWYA